jgi:hypothetical protein
MMVQSLLLLQAHTLIKVAFTPAPMVAPLGLRLQPRFLFIGDQSPPPLMVQSLLLFILIMKIISREVASTPVPIVASHGLIKLQCG